MQCYVSSVSPEQLVVVCSSGHHFGPHPVRRTAAAQLSDQDRDRLIFMNTTPQNSMRGEKTTGMNDAHKNAAS